MGSPYHPISWINGAIAAVHLALVPLSLLPPREDPVVFGSRATRWAKPYVEKSSILDWEKNKEGGKELVRRCDGLYSKIQADYARKKQRTSNAPSS